METDEEEKSWRGCPIEIIYRGLDKFELQHFPAVSPSDDHAVLYNMPYSTTSLSPPKPRKGYVKWDANHVRLPSSHRSQYPVIKEDGTEALECRWELVQNALLRPIKNSRELERAILAYNTKYDKIWNFKALHSLFQVELDEDESAGFFRQILPKIIDLALSLPELIPTAIPLLKQGQNKSISLSQQQAACLLANAFLCTFPRRNTQKKKSEYSQFPEINFNRLFQSHGNQVSEKIKCLCNYFRRVCSEMPTGVLTFTRRFVQSKDFPDWSKSNVLISNDTVPFHINSSGTIEDQGEGLLQVDFANKFIGGGVLGSGCVQEEIRFVICPELIIGKLFTEALKPQEALIMIGCEQFNLYSGYASSFTFDGDYIDTTLKDSSGRRESYIVGIDALHFLQNSHQYKEELMTRELNKAYVGFYHPLSTPAPGIASGNWGCGAFGGDAHLKALIQIMVCSFLRRPLVYFTFGDCELRDKIHQMYMFLIENKFTIAQLWTSLKAFKKHNLTGDKLYSFICQDFYDKSKQQTSIKTLLTSFFNPKKDDSKPSTPVKYPPGKDATISPSSDEILSELIQDLNDNDDDPVLPEMTCNERLDDSQLSSESDNTGFSLISAMDQSYYQTNPAKKICPSISPSPSTSKIKHEPIKETRIQIEEEVRTPSPPPLPSPNTGDDDLVVKCNDEDGEFIEASPTSKRKIMKKTPLSGTRKISDYFNKSNK